MVIDFLKVFDHLLPKSNFFSLVADRTFRKFFYALSITQQAVHDHIAGIIADYFPRLTSREKDHSTQLGSTLELPTASIESEWAAIGGQAPGYLQSILQNAGFDAYVHEWWEPGTSPPVARNPITTIAGTNYPVLVNDITIAEPNWTWQCDDYTMQCQEWREADDYPYRCDMFDGYLLRSKIYDYPDIEAEYVKYFYVGGATFPDPIYVSTFYYNELVRLIYKFKPTRLRCVLLVDRIIDTIQDSWVETDIIQNTINDTEILQNFGGV